MKYNRICVFLVCFSAFMFACTGDCRACHNNLNYKDDIRHIPMLSCKTCHTEAKMAQIEMGGCGQDCFACHDSKKVLSQALNKEHYMINTCIACHTQMGQTPINSGENIFQKGIKSFSSGAFGME